MDKNHIELVVNENLFSEFTALAKSKGCNIENTRLEYRYVTHDRCGNIIRVEMHCPKEHESLVCDYAFMTHIVNPIFQKYYLDSSNFWKGANEYIFDRTELEYVITRRGKVVQWDETEKCFFEVNGYKFEEFPYAIKTYSGKQCQEYIESHEGWEDDYIVYPIHLIGKASKFQIMGGILYHRQKPRFSVRIDREGDIFTFNAKLINWSDAKPYNNNDLSKLMEDANNFLKREVEKFFPDTSNT